MGLNVLSIFKFEHLGFGHSKPSYLDSGYLVPTLLSRLKLVTEEVYGVGDNS